ncbi:MAG: hypothetical protein ACTSWN_00260 [Promethearchaeota archaeon]
MEITRIEQNPIITSSTFERKRWFKEAANINGPTVIRAPKWFENPLGKYYLYFGHHHGNYIRLAFSEQPEGPYTLYKPGVLRNKKNTFIGKRHVASPEIYIDSQKREIRLYFHANIRGTGKYADQNQMTFLAISKNGIYFEIRPEQIGPFYMRLLLHDGMFYSIAKNDNKNAILLKSNDGLHEFERGPTFEPNYRHGTLLKKNNTLHLFYTRAREIRESIRHAKIDLVGDWKAWTPSDAEIVLEPEMPWEGANLPPTRSRHGSARHPMNALRDPFIFEENNKLFLFYCVKGEKGIAVARVKNL